MAVAASGKGSTGERPFSRGSKRFSREHCFRSRPVMFFSTIEQEEPDFRPDAYFLRALKRVWER